MTLSHSPNLQSGEWLNRTVVATVYWFWESHVVDVLGAAIAGICY
ncbi:MULTISPECIES: hypothetical protein [Nostocales]|uniref:Uncharacterized protein n=1 Tax=Tolypothrix campylonemoides VB511288_2 TaxID=3232311 RepID=A0ABW8XMU7_9CYAN